MSAKEAEKAPTEAQFLIRLGFQLKAHQNLFLFTNIPLGEKKKSFQVYNLTFSFHSYKCFLISLSLHLCFSIFKHYILECLGLQHGAKIHV